MKVLLDTTFLKIRNIEYITFLHFASPYYNYDQWDFVPSIIGLQFRESNISTCNAHTMNMQGQTFLLSRC